MSFQQMISPISFSNKATPFIGQGLSLLVSLFFFLIAQVAFSQQPSSGFPGRVSAQNIKVGPGPEDMIYDTLSGGQRIIVSCAQRRKGEPEYGGFWSIDPKTLVSKELTRDGEPEDLGLHPHGIALTRNRQNQVLLYAISHKKAGKKTENMIVVYEVYSDRLRFKEIIQDKSHLLSPNDLTATPDGRIYVSNDYGGGMALVMRHLFATKASKIGFYDGEIWKFVGGKYRYANGIHHKDNRLFLTTTKGGELFRFDIWEDGSLKNERRIVNALSGLDNISFDHPNELITTGHPDPMAFIAHMRDPKKLSPVVVYRVNPKEGTTEVIYQNEGKEISAASTAIRVGDRLFISQVFDAFVRMVPLN